MGMFDADVDLTKIETDPNKLPDGTYKAFLKDAKIVDLTAKDKGKSLVLTYRVAEGEHEGKEKDEWKRCDKDASPLQLGWLKQRLLDLGVPEAKLNEVDASDLIATAVYVTFKTKGEYQNVVKVRLDDGSAAVDAVAVADLL